MLFNTKKDFTLIFVFLFIFILLSPAFLFSILFENDNSLLWLFFGLVSFIVLLFISIFKTTYFRLDEDVLFCKSLIFTKKIFYSSIRKVEKQKGIYAGLKFSTAWRGLVIHYNKFDELLISPEDEEIFIEKLNEHIELRKSGKDF